MINPEEKQAVLTLYKTGKAKKEIARLLELDIKTVRRIISGGTAVLSGYRSDRIRLDEELLRREYKRCAGYAQRVHEILTEEHGIAVSYSTLTQKIREMGLRDKKSSRSCHVDDVPGEEMQHDTSPYSIKIGGQNMRLVLSGLYLRYSKLRYIKFYRSFNRFAMKCFMDEYLS